MKQILTLLISLSFCLTSFATPQIIAGAKLIKSINTSHLPEDIQRHFSNLSKNKEIFKGQYSIDKLSPSHIVLMEKSKKYDIKYLGDRTFSINNNKIVLNEDDTTKMFLQKIETALIHKQASLLESLFIPQAKALGFIIPIGAFIMIAAMSTSAQCNKMLGRPAFAKVSSSDQKQCSEARKFQKASNTGDESYRKNFGNSENR